MGTRQRRQREAQQRRQTILAAAMKLFRKHGYVKTTMPRIAAAAELAPGTLYLYFPSKDALYLELLSEGYDILLERLTAAVARPLPPAEQAAGLIDAFFEFAREYPEYFDIIFFVLQRERSGSWEEQFPTKQVQGLQAKESACKAVAAAVLQRAGARPGLDRRLTVDVVWSMLTGVVSHFGADADLPRMAQYARRLIIKAIFAPG